MTRFACNPVPRVVASAWLVLAAVSFPLSAQDNNADDAEAGDPETQPTDVVEDNAGEELAIDPPEQGEQAEKPINKSLLDERRGGAGVDQQLDDLPNFGESLIRMVIVLVAMIVMMLVLAKLLPRWLSRRGPSSGKQMRVVDRMQVEPGRSLLVVHVGGQYLLMASDSDGLRVVAQDTIDQEAMRSAFDQDGQAPAPKSGGFSTLLNASRAVGDGPAATPGKEASA